MSLERRLRRWVTAGLVTTEQAQRIRDFERDRGRPLFLHAVAGLAGLAIAIGCVSIVAANWDVIPGRVKIGIDLLLVATLGWLVARWSDRGPRWAFEATLVILYGSVMASIALVGQVYQLGGKAHEAMGTWTVLTAVLMSRSHTAVVAFLWLCGLQVTWAAWSTWIGDHHRALQGLALASIYWAPLLCVVIGLSPRIEQLRPQLSSVFLRVGWAELVLCGSLGTFAFYDDTMREDWDWLPAGAALSAMMTGWIWMRLRGAPGRTPLRALALSCLLLAHVPLMVSPGNLDVVAAVTFIALWVLVAFVGHRLGDVRVLNFATAVIGVRILVVYFEVFGSLLGTGVGLVSGGLLTLALVWLWARKRSEFARSLGKAGVP